MKKSKPAVELGRNLGKTMAQTIVDDPVFLKYQKQLKEQLLAKAKKKAGL